jgi:hypothetical protein
VDLAVGEAVGYKLYDMRDTPDEFPIAIDVALPDPNQPVSRGTLPLDG